MGVSSSYFVPAAERLATEFDVYVHDIPAPGPSDTSDVQPDIPRLAEALVNWMNAQASPGTRW
jgi:hypothetical protein